MRQQHLPDVVVRPRHEAVVSPYEGRRRPINAYALIPGIQVAVHLTGTADDPITGIRLHLKDDKVKQGRLRVRLVAAGTDKPTTVPNGPDLMTPVTFSANQLPGPDGLLTIPLQQQNVVMPQGGVFVIIEGLGNERAPEYVAVTVPSKGSGGPKVVMKGEDTVESTPLEEWVQLKGATTKSEAHTWVNGHNGKGWLLRHPKGTREDVMNSDVELVVFSH
ncbi:hypothetical protein KLP40_14805 [Hymenobacter sp. NST-14]|uniref:hypothetical protein n=1 Tax=Hymenobacter piscis TaxID=2839984 RepID=UPI001C025766|nr:hypothetical protein [Hymenobacter piscis]MBT9394439.1 hypothetical protein [Hymenobacter piscis]